MAFNFMAALGGFGRQVSANIESQKEFDRQKEFKLELLAEEEATKMRLQRSAERKAQREKDKAMAGKLKALGFSDDRVAFALAQGTGYAEGIADIASVAMAKGKNPNTLLTYSDSMDQFKKLSGTERDGIRVGPVDTTKIPEGFDYSTAFTQDVELTTSVLTEEKDEDTQEFNNLDELYTYFKNEQFQHEVDSVEWKAIDKKLESIRTDMHEIAKQKDTSTPPDDTPDPLISQNQYNNDIKTARAAVSGKYNLTTLEGEFEALETGRQAVSQVAELEAALRVRKGYDALEGESSLKTQGMSRANTAIDNQVSSLSTLATQTYQAWKSQRDQWVKDGNDVVKFKPQGLGAKWKMPPDKLNFDLKKMIADAKAGNTTALMEFSNYVDSLDYGDIIQVDGHLATFTGLTHIYNNLKDPSENALKMPLLFVGNISPDSKYMYTGMDF